MAKLDDLPRVEITSRKAWRAWLKANHAKSGAVWAVTFKKPDPRHVPVSDINEEALCFGWIDSLPRKLDDKRSMLLLAPRKPESAWSKINKERAGRLIAEGQMEPAGHKVIDEAKASGTWSKLDGVEALELPPDLTKAFAKSKAALKNFEAFPRSVKRGILEWIIQAKKAETRAARIAETVSKAKDNIRANQWRQ
ncbi:MAG: YdeI/OmpD-associated family protein [Aestuariivirga sp.]